MHRPRPSHDARCPVHVTLRVGAGIGSLRGPRLFGAVRRAMARATDDGFRLLHFSVQVDHVHLLVEAEGTATLRSGVQGLAIRIARAVNRALGRRGRVWGDRYHARILRTPREVRNALVYVLANWRKHLPGVRGLDPCSSALWFAGWRSIQEAITGTAPVASARTWLARVGWRRHGLIDVAEAPRLRRR